MSGSAAKEYESDSKTPKANLRQERINNTRPGLVVTDTKSLTTINEESQYSEATFNHANSMRSDWNCGIDLGRSKSNTLSSSEFKSQNTGNLD